MQDLPLQNSKYQELEESCLVCDVSQANHLIEDQEGRALPKLKFKLRAELNKNQSLMTSAWTSSHPARASSNQKGATGKWKLQRHTMCLPWNLQQ